AILDVDQREFDANQLQVVGGTLQQMKGGSLQPFDLCNYCLLRIETSKTRNDFTTLPFHQSFRKAQQKLLSGTAAEAKALLVECLNGVLASADLSGEHKYQLVEYYQVAFLKDKERFSKLAMDGVDLAGAASAPSRGETSEVTAELEMTLMRQRVDAHPALEATGPALRHIESQLAVADGSTTEPAATPESEEARIASYLAARGGSGAAMKQRSSVDDLVAALTVGVMAE
ncbi:MAG: hypothetical protein JWQ11_1311, partial [Rhizobacter sp.]|nr:hypothetical protein [Rhizobacter sp.]